MILAGLKKKNLKKYFEKQINNKEVSNSSIIKTILIITDDTINLNSAIENQLINEFSSHKFQIEELTFKAKKDKLDLEERYFYKDDFGWNGSLKSNNLQKIVKNDYDLLINYTKEDNVYINTITLLSKAKFKVGRKNVDDRLFDLIIDCNVNDLQTFHLELKKYLQILNRLE